MQQQQQQQLQQQQGAFQQTADYEEDGSFLELYGPESTLSESYAQDYMKAKELHSFDHLTDPEWPGESSYKDPMMYMKDENDMQHQRIQIQQQQHHPQQQPQMQMPQPQIPQQVPTFQ
eukprot:Awhi_evm1s7838